MFNFTGNIFVRNFTKSAQIQCLYNMRWTGSLHIVGFLYKTGLYKAGLLNGTKFINGDNIVHEKYGGSACREPGSCTQLVPYMELAFVVQSLCTDLALYKTLASNVHGAGPVFHECRTCGFLEKWNASTSIHRIFFTNLKSIKFCF